MVIVVGIVLHIAQFFFEKNFAKFAFYY